MDLSLANVRPPRPAPRNRARELLMECRIKLEIVKGNIDKEHYVEATASAGARSITIGSMGAVDPDFICCEGRNCNGDFEVIIAPVEQFVFSLVVRKISKGIPRCCDIEFKEG